MYKIHRYAGAAVLVVIFASFLLAVLDYRSIFITIRISLGLLFVIFNLTALFYGIATRKQD
ncbi:MAG: hypothetical protein Q8O41_07165 [Candidatus Methanoperedens sp.]|nr:hypothetical protein [Candidatus Methanoperedens sp.]